MQESITATAASTTVSVDRRTWVAGREVLRLGAANLALILSAQIAVPLPTTPVPVVMTTLAISLISVWLGASRAALVLGAYLLEGAVGLPVFQPFGAPGALRFVGPTGGYLMVYPIAAFVMGWLTSGWQRKPLWRTAAGVVSGHAIILAGGSMWLALGLGMGVAGGLRAGAVPFLAGAIVKTALALGIVVAWRRRHIDHPDVRRVEP